MSVLVNIHRKKESINTVYSLEESDALHPDGKFTGTILCGVTFQHLHRGNENIASVLKSPGRRFYHQRSLP